MNAAVLQLPLESELDRAWRRFNAELARFERQYGKNAPGGDEPLEAAFEALRRAIRAEELHSVSRQCACDGAALDYSDDADREMFGDDADYRIEWGNK